MATQTDPTRYLRRLLESGQHNDVAQMIRDRDSVLSRYGPLFRDPAGLDTDTLVEFLQFENNRHWWNLHRESDRLTRHFELLRDVLAGLVDEDRDLVGRIDDIEAVPGLSPELATVVLSVAYPDRYGVWSGISEAAMRRLGMWPDVSDGSSDGLTYAVVNEMLLTIAADLDVDLWTLDALWWGAEKEHDPTRHFVARSRSRASGSPARRATSRPAVTRAPRPEAATFMCENCFATKPLRLESDTPGLCVDCA